MTSFYHFDVFTIYTIAISISNPLLKVVVCCKNKFEWNNADMYIEAVGDGEATVRFTTDELRECGSLFRKAAQVDSESPAAESLADQMEELAQQTEGRAIPSAAERIVQLAAPLQNGKLYPRFSHRSQTRRGMLTPPPRRQPVRLGHILGPKGMEERRKEAEDQRASMPPRRRPHRS
jgi:hypothetical protein